MGQSQRKGNRSVLLRHRAGNLSLVRSTRSPFRLRNLPARLGLEFGKHQSLCLKPIREIPPVHLASFLVQFISLSGNLFLKRLFIHGYLLTGKRGDWSRQDASFADCLIAHGRFGEIRGRDAITVWLRMRPNRPWSRPKEKTAAADFLLVRAIRPLLLSRRITSSIP